MAETLPPLPPAEVPQDRQLVDARAGLAVACDHRAQASRAADAARAAYEAARRADPAAQSTDRARHAWAQALADWTDARVRVERARDELNAIHRQTAEGPDA